MGMKFAFFPGCVLKGAAGEAYTSMQKVCEKLDIELEEIPNWTCCGASHAQGVNDFAALVVNARNISIAENMGLPIMTVCNTCTLQLRNAKKLLDSDQALKDKVNGILKDSGHPYEYKGTSEITHFLWVLDKNPEILNGKVTKPLTGVKVAAYYGCHILRPNDVMNYEDGKNPHSFEKLVKALGADPVPFDESRLCCGFHALYPAEDDVMRAVGKIITSADKAQAQMIVTPCPLCQMQFDMYGDEGVSTVGTASELPILHLQQLVGLALGFTKEEMGFDRHLYGKDKLKI